MVQNVCMTYVEKPGIPQSLKEEFTSHLEGKFGDLELNIQFMQNCQEFIFEYIQFYIFPEYKEVLQEASILSPRGESMATRRATSFLEGDALDDPFDNFTENSIRTLDTEKGEMIVAATVERIINILTG